jgi:hypothetical protein
MGMTETWVDIPSLEGLYQVSDSGLIKSCYRVVMRRNGAKMTVQERIIKQRKSNNGYLIVSLANNGRYMHSTVHKLVTRAFLGDMPEGKEVAHGDGVKTNNNLQNLRYATKLENAHDKVIHGTSRKGELHHFAKIRAEDVKRIREDKRSQESIGIEFGVSQTLVSMIKRKVIWIHV